MVLWKHLVSLSEDINCRRATKNGLKKNRYRAQEVIRTFDKRFTGDLKMTSTVE